MIGVILLAEMIYIIFLKKSLDREVIHQGYIPGRRVCTFGNKIGMNKVAEVPQGT
jgi:hypothetical protein